MAFDYLAPVTSKLRELRGDGRGTILAVIASGWALTIGGRMIYPVLLPYLRTAYELDLVAAGFLLTILFTGYALGQLPGGIFADRVGERITLSLSLAISAGALAVVIVARSSPLLFVMTGIFGFGVGFYAIARFTAIANIYPSNYGTAIGLTNSTAEIGQALLPPAAGVIAVVVGWQYGFGFTIPIFVLLVVALWVVVPKRPPERTSSADTLSLKTGRYVLSELHNRPIVLGTAILILGMSIWQALTGFYPTYLIEEKGVSSTVASVIFGIYFAVSALSHPISGAIYDRWNIRYTFLLVGASVLGFAALPLVEGIWPLVVVTVLLGTFMCFATAIESYLVNALPHDMEGTGFGVLRTFSFVIGALSPIFFGQAADLGFFDEVFLVLGVLVFVMVLVGIRLPED